MKNFIALAALFLASVTGVFAQVAITTWQMDSSHTGLNSHETVLTPASVSASGNFGLLFTQPTDGQMVGQPLIVPNLTINGGTHNVVFVATEHDSVYAFDADNKTGANASPLWKVSLLPTGTTPVPSSDTGSGDISDEIGITTTPVIDTATSTIYVVTKVKKTSDGSYHHYFHALNLLTGAEKNSGPVEITTTFPGSSNYNGNEQTTAGVVPFNPLHEHLRSAMALNNGIVYLAYASHGDVQPYHGIILGYDKTTLQLVKKFISTPNDVGSGFWGAGASPAFDSSNNMFISTANGGYDQDSSPYTSTTDWGESVLKMSTSGALSVSFSNTLNWFTPNIWGHLNSFDLDLGSSGVTLLPDQSGPHTHILVTGGKGGVLYVLDRDNLGGENSTDASIQQFSTPNNNLLFATPAYFNGNIYYAANNSQLEQRTVGYNSTTGNYISPTSVVSSRTFPNKGAGCFVTSNGTSNGIVWILYGNGMLAYDATNVAAAPLHTCLATTEGNVQCNNTKFSLPAVANGKAYFTGYVEAGNSRSTGYLFVYGIFPSANGTPTAPSNAAATGASANSMTVTWSDNSSNETGFVVKRATSAAGPFTQTGVTVGANVTSFVDTGLTANTIYYYQVVAQNANGSSSSSNTASGSTFPTFSAPGLVAYWMLDEDSGVGTAADATGNGHTGSVVGEAVYAQGIINNAIDLHGTGNAPSNIQIPNSPALQFTAAQSFTISAWVFPANLNGNEQAVIAKSADQGNGYGIYINAAGNYVFRGPNGDLVGAAAALTQWDNVEVVQDGAAGTRKIYVDGVLGQTGAAQAGDGVGDFWIGQQNDQNQLDSFPGMVDDVRVYNRAVSAAETTDLMTTPILEGLSTQKSGSATFGLIVSPSTTNVVEPRTGVTAGSYTLVLNFSAPVSGITASLTKQGGGAATGSVSSVSYDSTGKIVTVKLSGVGNAQALNLHFSGVQPTISTVDFPFTVLRGDVNSDNIVDYLDASIVANNQTGAVTSSNYLYDLNGDGVVNSTDTSLVTAAIGTSVGTELDTNLAIYQPSSDLSSTSPNTSPKAFDQDMTTRWESAQQIDPEWVEVDLGSVCTIHSIVLTWEAAAGATYNLQSSTDNINWTNLLPTITNSTAGTKTYSGLSGSGRFVRMLGLTRTGNFGYSLYDFQVIGHPGATTANTAPSITGDLSLSGTQGTSLSYSIAAANAATSYSATGLPAGLTLNQATGLISGSPTGSGNFTAFLTASNSHGTSASTPLAFKITGSANAPVITSAGTATGKVGTAFTYQITATNSPSSFTATGLPAGLTVNTTSGVISGTPTTAGGPTTVTITAKNASGVGSGSVAITISTASPTITSAGSATGEVNSAFSYQITASGSPTSFGATNLPAGLSVNSSTGLISGTPTTAGSKTAVISATNGSGTGTANLAFTIKPPPPVITSGTTATGSVGTAFSYQITATNSPTGYAASNLPAGLSVNTATGLISGTPTTAGSKTVSVSATNAGGTATANVAVTINSAKPAITSATTASGVTGTAFTYQITASNSPTSFNATNLPAGLSVNTSTGLISGTPTAVGTTTVALSATNVTGTGTANLSITVKPPAPAITSATTASGTVNSAFSYQITASNNPTSFAATNLPAGLSVNTTTGLISGTPTTAGPKTVALSATNAGGTGTANLAVTIASAGNPPTVTSATTVVGTVGTPFTYQITATNNPTSFNATNLPAGLSVNTTTGLISGTPTTVGGKAVLVSATNAAGTGSVTAGFNMNAPAPVVSSATTATGKVGTAFSYQITASNSPTSYAATNLPAGLSVNGATGLISGTPTTAGSKTVAISATNASGTGTANVSVTINPATPAITSAATASGTAGTAFSYQIAASNTPTSFNATNLPAGLGINTSTGLISGTPTAAGSSTVTLSATNAGGTGTKSLSVTIASSVSAPVVSSAATASGTVGIAFSYQIAASNSPASFNATNLPAGLSVNTATGVVSGTPTAAATTSMTVSATNAGGTGTKSVSVTIKPPAPVISSATNGTGKVGTAFSYQITASNSPTSYAATNLPAGLSVNGATGLISGNPTTAGVKTVAISATNATGTGTANVSVTINPATPVISSAATASGTVGSSFSYQITASNTPTSFNATNLPAGLSVSTSTGLISGTPTASGSTTVTLSATNTGGTGTKTLTITIAASGAAPVVSSATTASGTVGTAFSYQIAASNSPTSFNTTNLPAGLSVNTSTGLVSGTPTAAATTSMTVSATNATGTGTRSVSVTIKPHAPVMTSSTTATGNVGSAFSYQITASNNPTSFGASNAPAGLTVNSTTGVISGTPTTAGTKTMTITATNAGGTGSTGVTVTINPPAPAITSSATATGNVNTAFSYQITASNSPTSFGATNLPAGLSVNTSTGLISGTPTTAATTTVTISATNASGTGTHSLTVTIKPPAPAVTSGITASGTVGTAFSYQITATNSPTSFAATNLPAGLSVNTTTGLISGTPTTSGSKTVTVSATNASGTGTRNVSITIAAATPVVTSPTTATGSVGASFSYQITASNTPTSFSASNLPAGLSINTANGLVSGTPTTAATSTMTVSATNAGGTGSRNVSVTISAASNVPAITSPTTVSVAVNAAINYRITATNSPTSYDAVNLPTGFIVNKATGLLSGRSSSAGTFSVTISAANANGTGSAILTLTVTGSGTPAITSATTASGTVGTALSYQITASNSPTSFGASNLPAGLSVNSSTGLISGTPTSAGSSTSTVTAANGSGTGSASVAFTIASAGGPPSITSATTASGSVGAAFNYQIIATGSPTSYGATNLPAGLSVNTSTGLISGTPTTAGGPTTVMISATNGNGSDTQNVSITISAATTVPMITSPTTATATVGAAFGYRIVATNKPTYYDALNLPTGLSINHATGLISGRPLLPANPANITISAQNDSGTGTANLAVTISP